MDIHAHVYAAHFEVVDREGQLRDYMSRIRRTELGTLASGAEADVAVFELHKGRFGFVDCGGERRVGNQKLECLLTVGAGKIVYDPTGPAPGKQLAPRS